jgi:hypothetical protein
MYEKISIIIMHGRSLSFWQVIIIMAFFMINTFGQVFSVELPNIKEVLNG